MKTQKLDLVIVGGGQAGLASAYYASRCGLSYTVLEAGDGPGQSWKNRYDSLTLFTPRKYSTLPGMPLSGDPEGYPTKDEVADYLRRYAEHLHLNIEANQRVAALGKEGDIFSIETPTNHYQSRKVIVATGPFQTPRVPAWNTKLTIPNIHSAKYRNPGQLPSGKVLVVGGGNSGAQIAEELAATREVVLAARGKLMVIPTHIAGKSLFWWLDKLHLLNAPTESLRAKYILKRGEPIIGTNLPTLIKQGKVRVKPEATDGDADDVAFADGSSEQFESVIWSTGYTTDYSWLQIPQALDGDGRPLHLHGQATQVEGLYFVGLNWLRSRNSALLGGVGADAKFIFDSYISKKAIG